MSEEHPKLDAIAKARVEKLAENLKSTAENVLDLISSEEIQVEPLLEATRFMARTARRIGRRANWSIGEAPPGNRKDDDERPKRRAAPAKDAAPKSAARRPSSSARSPGAAPRRAGSSSTSAPRERRGGSTRRA